MQANSQMKVYIWAPNAILKQNESAHSPFSRSKGGNIQIENNIAGGDQGQLSMIHQGLLQSHFRKMLICNISIWLDHSQSQFSILCLKKRFKIRNDIFSAWLDETNNEDIEDCDEEC